MGGIDPKSTTIRVGVEKGTPVSGDNTGAVALCSVDNLVGGVVRIGRTLMPFLLPSPPHSQSLLLQFTA